MKTFYSSVKLRALRGKNFFRTVPTSQVNLLILVVFFRVMRLPGALFSMPDNAIIFI